VQITSQLDVVKTGTIPYLHEHVRRVSFSTTVYNVKHNCTGNSHFNETPATTQQLHCTICSKTKYL